MYYVLIHCCVDYKQFMCTTRVLFICICCFFFQAEDGIRDLVRSRGLGDVYKRQTLLVLAINCEGVPFSKY